MPGVTPGKWVRIWTQRQPDVRLDLAQVTAAEAEGVLRVGGADAALLRLPVDRTVFSAIPLYTETTVVVCPKDHLVAAADEVTVEDIAEEIVLHPLDDTLDWERPPGEPAFERPATTADAIELVAAGIGLLIVPQSLARLHHRKDLTYRTITGTPQSQVALSWPEEATTDLVEDFIGIVRGRTVNSSRGRRPDEKAAKAAAKTAKPKGQGQKQQPRQGQKSGQGQKPQAGGGGRRKAGGGAAKSSRSGKPRRRS
ncbi:LysR family transcriptional regulator substrate-binding protein [Streptomyces sp. SKN60]|uniref:LysR family transcriptional regulator substrate-binding protein n=1 Tax=Streptomyces sp. SKN60 TaxID=2855506 RepID=UPI002245E163|nr:LysR family transcriptional regulator substrate-binding protein [Streptomyces sp. SKN60]